MHGPERVTYRSSGLDCAADLYLPSSVTDGSGEPVAAIVCGESGAKVKEMVAAPARYLVDAGFAVLAIDYRSFGASEGEPRGQLFPEQQVGDFRAALSYLSSRDEIDSDRLGVWGNSVAGSVVVQTAVTDRRVRCVVAQSPSMLDGWSATQKQAGSLGFGRLRTALQEDWNHRQGSPYGGARIPWLQFAKAGDDVSQSFVDLGAEYPTFRNEILLESWEHLLHWAPAHLIDRLAPTPLLIVTNSGPDPYHELDEIQSAYARAGEPKRLTLLPYDSMGFYTEPGTGEAMSHAVAWFDEHLRRAPLPPASTETSAATLSHHRTATAPDNN